jgi:hypothetical protein
LLKILFQQGLQYLTGAASYDLFFKRASLGTVTEGSTYIPAEMPALKLPGRALFMYATLFSFPAGDEVPASTLAITEKKEDLTFNVGRDISPSLLVTMNRLHCDSEKFRHLFLCLSELSSGFGKFCTIHLALPLNENSY